MRVVNRTDGCIVIQSDDSDDADEIVIEPALERLASVANNFHCHCGAVLGTRDLIAGAEIECPRCFTVHARFELGLRWYR
jgi:hypothetical protein